MEHLEGTSASSPARTRPLKLPGLCIDTAGVVVKAELERVQDTDAEGTTSGYDADSDSDMVTFGGPWAAYLSEDMRVSRREPNESYNLAGTVNSAIGLAEFVDGGGETLMVVDATGKALALLTLVTDAVLSFKLQTFLLAPTDGELFIAL